jgi:hypothetical protein
MGVLLYETSSASIKIFPICTITAPFGMGLKKIDYPKNKERQPAALS